MRRTPVLMLLFYFQFMVNAFITSPPLIIKQQAESEVILISNATNSSDVLKPIYFHCEADGVPRPSFRWMKNGEPFIWDLYKNRMAMLPGYGTLIITQLFKDDVGQYQCFATNQFGTATSNSFSVRVNNDRGLINRESMPSFTKAPEPITTAGEQDAIFYCDAQGTPKPKIMWLFNGKPIEEAPVNNRRIVAANSITVKDLIISDTGNYGCNASNSFGYVYRDAYLNVVNEPPIIVNPPSPVTTVEHTNVTFQCKAFGIPAPHIKWLKDGQVLGGDRFMVKTIGSLEIINVTIADAGTYQCYSENKYGITTANGQLNVKHGTKFVEWLEDEVVEFSGNVMLNCEAEADTDLEITYNWLKDGQFIYMGTSTMDKYSVDQRDAGEYSCIVSTQLDRIKSKAKITITGVPNNPRIRNIECWEKAAIISWTHQGDNNSPIKFYTIEYITSFNRTKWISFSKNIPPEESTYTFEMRPWTKYNFRIRAHNKHGSSEPSDSSYMCQSQGDIPYRNPVNVHGYTDGRDLFRIQWDPIPLEEHNARNFRYRVLWKTDLSDEWASKELCDWSQSSLVIPDKLGGQRYRIKVLAVNQYGEANVNPIEVIGYSDADLTEAPTNLTVVPPIEEDEVLLGWTKVPQDKGISRFAGYKIQIWFDNNQDLYREIVIRGSTNRALITNLNSYSKYFASISAFNDGYDGPKSDKISFTTLEKRLGPVDQLHIVPLGAFGLWLTWKPPFGRYKLTGYVIYYHEILGTQMGEKIIWQQRTLDPKITSTKLAGLKPNTNYFLKIRAISSRGEGFDCTTEENTLAYEPNLPDTPSFVFEKTLSNTNNSDNAIKIQWLPFGNHAGSHFYAQYRKKDMPSWETTSVELNEDFIIIDRLDRNSTYEIRIVAVDGEYVADSLSKFVEKQFFEERSEILHYSDSSSLKYGEKPKSYNHGYTVSRRNYHNY